MLMHEVRDVVSLLPARSTFFFFFCYFHLFAYVNMTFFDQVKVNILKPVAAFPLTIYLYLEESVCEF